MALSVERPDVLITARHAVRINARRFGIEWKVVIVDYVIGIPLLDYILVGVWAQAQCLCRVDFPDLAHRQTVNVRRAATRRSNPLWDRARVRIGIGPWVKDDAGHWHRERQERAERNRQASRTRSFLIRPRIEWCVE
jgi:hypothetical protein